MINNIKTNLLQFSRYFVAITYFIFLSNFNHVFATEYFAEFEKTGITSNELALLVNLNDQQSIEVAKLYAQKRGIPEKNIIYLSFSGGRNEMNLADFTQIKQEVEKKTNSNIQAYVISWSRPYKVGCMSITSAITFGYNQAYCGGCKPTKDSAYFNATTSSPWSDLNIRPTMMLAGDNTKDVSELIERGIHADSTFPNGNSYLIKGSGGSYDVRSVNYTNVREQFHPNFLTYITKHISKPLQKHKNILFYFIGTPQLSNLDQLEFLPGAMADHLTSYGGDLYGGRGQSVIQTWLKAGATGSYGTVEEPCNHLTKFPNPNVAMHYYLGGNTLIEAYWKSVAWPGQGLFIGEPLASPFKPTFTNKDGHYMVKMYSHNPAMLQIYFSSKLTATFTKVLELPLVAGLNQLTMPPNITKGEGGFFKFAIQ